MAAKPDDATILKELQDRIKSSFSGKIKDDKIEAAFADDATKSIFFEIYRLSILFSIFICSL